VLSSALRHTNFCVRYIFYFISSLGLKFFGYRVSVHLWLVEDQDRLRRPGALFRNLGFGQSPFLTQVWGWLLFVSSSAGLSLPKNGVRTISVLDSQSSASIGWVLLALLTWSS